MAVAALVAAGADLAVACVVLLLAVAGTAVLGYAPGLFAAIAGAVALNYYFTPPVHSFRIDRADDILALAAFVTVAVLVGATIARLNELRRRAEVHAREARLRVALTEELRRGVDLEIVLRRLASELDELFDLARCRITVDERLEPTRPDGDVLVRTSPLSLRLTPTRPLGIEELAVVRGLGTAVATAIELDRLDADAREQRLQREIERSRAGFLTAVTHDLRTPLATIKAASAALLGGGSRLDETDRRELLQDTYAEAARLERQVDKVLAMARVRSGVLVLDPTPVAPLDLVHSVTTRWRHALRERVLELDLDPDLPAIRVDVLLMEHALANLLENAAVHAPSDRPIVVTGRAHDGVVSLAVVDHGPGVPAEDRVRIFDEFVRRSAATDGTGTGLGLAIVRAVIETHGGAVWCAATPAGGATFVVELPADEEGQET